MPRDERSREIEAKLLMAPLPETHRRTASDSPLAIDERPVGRLTPGRTTVTVAAGLTWEGEPSWGKWTGRSCS